MIHIGTDHAGFELKEKLKSYFAEIGYEVKDHGAFGYDAVDDYPDFIRPVAEAVAKDPDNEKGIVLGGSGQGEAMVANRYRGVRAVVFYCPHFNETAQEIIRLSREHNNANVLSLGARFLDEETAKKAVKLWLDTAFQGEERHVRRLKKIDG
ncbi:MAG: RpiB/LacA/LacB family sugar-phosphate isomerase [Candidatus Niyogibacteria bacterium]|nr:RpiB/LacA/LacB family sugar-phosphate isomerase [Candidatus Niyogibacteria bacterium]